MKEKTVTTIWKENVLARIPSHDSKKLHHREWIRRPLRQLERTFETSPRKSWWQHHLGNPDCPESSPGIILAIHHTNKRKNNRNNGMEVAWIIYWMIVNSTVCRFWDTKWLFCWLALAPGVIILIHGLLQAKPCGDERMVYWVKCELINPPETWNGVYCMFGGSFIMIRSICRAACKYGILLNSPIVDTSIFRQVLI